MTTSRFPGYEKHFFSIGATEQTAKLYPITTTLLRGKSPKYPPHVSLLTMHLKSGSDVAMEMEKTKTIFFDQMSELATPLEIDGPEVINQHYEIMGTAPECFCIVFNLVDCRRLQMLRDLWIETLCEKYKLTKGDYLPSVITDSSLNSKVLYSTLVDSDGQILAWFSNQSIAQKKLHTTLISSFDLKNANKKLYKEYCGSEDRLAYLVAHYGELL